MEQTVVFGPVSFEREDEVEGLHVGFLFRNYKSAGFQSFSVISDYVI